MNFNCDAFIVLTDKCLNDQKVTMMANLMTMMME